MQVENREALSREHTSFPETFRRPIERALKGYTLRTVPYEKRPNGDFTHVTHVVTHGREHICTILMYPSGNTKLPAFDVIYDIVSPDREIQFASLESKSPLNVEELSSQIASAIADVQEYPNSQTRRVHE